MSIKREWTVCSWWSAAAEFGTSFHIFHCSLQAYFSILKGDVFQCVLCLHFCLSLHILLFFHCVHGVIDAWTTWCGVGAHGWVAEIASYGRGTLSRGCLVTVEAPRHPSLSPIFHTHIVLFYLLMLLPSFKRTPSAPLLLALSLPAKSTRLSLLTFSPTDYK